MFKIRVADLRLDFTTDCESFFEKRFNGYLCDGNTPSDMTVKTAVFDTVPFPKGITLKKLKAFSVCRVSNDKLCCFVGSSEENVLFAVYYTEDFSTVEIQIKKGLKRAMLDEISFAYSFSGAMFANRLTCLGGTVLHSSALAYNGKGICFTAPSGTGKSTHVSLWQKKLGDKVTIINDDKPAIRFIDGKPYLYGTPWSGKTELNTNIKAPLSAIVCLERGDINKIEKVDPIYGISFLSKQLPNPFYDGNIGKMSVDIVKKLYETTPIYRLQCNISEDAVDTVLKALEE